MPDLSEHRDGCALLTFAAVQERPRECDCDPNHRELPVTIPSIQVQMAARALCPAASRGGPCSRCCDAVAGGIARGQNATLQREVDLNGRLMVPIREDWANGEGHVVDRHGAVWRVVRDGGMLTRADYAGVITIGVVAAESLVGPLTPLGELLR